MLKSTLLYFIFICTTQIHCDYVFFKNKTETKEKYFKDLWGYKVNCSDPDDGWNEIKQKMFLVGKRRTLQQINEFPMYTKYGFKKTRIPKDLYKDILDIRNNSTLEVETCEYPNSKNNCYKIKTIPAVPMKRGYRHLPGM